MHYVSKQWILLILTITISVNAQSVFYGDLELQCPQHWFQREENCYRIVKSPLRNREDARKHCQTYQGDLVQINSLDEYGFLQEKLKAVDPQHHKWYTGVKIQGGGPMNEVDGTPVVGLENVFLPERISYNSDAYSERDYVVYAWSDEKLSFRLAKVSGSKLYPYICEAYILNLKSLIEENRTYEFGLEITDPTRIPRGPYFIKQPEDKIFDISKRVINNDISLSCLAGGYPTPTYEWFKEDFKNDRMVARRIDPLLDGRYTLSGGTLIIFAPNQTEDRGTYHCKATNKFGTIKSESVELSFGYILEFNLKRSEERGDEHWGKAIYCDPPQHFPGVKYYWVRESFPRFVDEDKRVFVSYDGALYFSALEKIDVANYSCNVQSVASDTGRNGPFFPLYMNSHLTPQQLKFPNNFPKVFPEAPKAGDQVRLECIAFGYPVPSYNWTRIGGDLPRNSYLMNYNRVLIIPHVRVEDQGEYVCRAKNEKISIKNSVSLSIQAAPTFTIPLEDKHMDNRADLTWSCESFGIPDVVYFWLRNGELLNEFTLPPEDRDRYIIQDNVLKIKNLDPEKDEAMYQCAAFNQLKHRYSSAQLRILSLKPSFKKRPLEPETYAAEGGNVTIKCNPEAAPKPEYTWKRDQYTLSGQGKHRILESGDLVIYRVSRDDQGQYTCIAKNQYGRDESRGYLKVLRGPSFVNIPPERLIVNVKENQTLTCQAEGDERLDIAYVWKHNDMEIQEGDLYKNLRTIVFGGRLKIINTTFADAGVYECIVKSVVGDISANTTLVVHGPPGPPGGIQVVNVDRTSVTLRWTDGAYNGMRAIKYAIGARTNWNQTWFILAEGITATTQDRYASERKETKLDNVLSPFTTYEFRVAAANELGYGYFSMPSPQYSTPPAKPSKHPNNISGGGGKIGDLTIKWDPLQQEDQHGPNVYYKVFWKRKGGESEFQTQVLKEYGNVGMMVVQIPSKFYYTEYEVRVQAANEIGYGPISPIYTIYSAEDMPQVAPQLVYARGYNSTALNVTWQPIEQTREKVRGKLIGHRIKYWKKENREEDSVYYLSRTTRPWSLVVGLQPDTYYYVKVMAYNSAGEGPESERFLERTYRKAPQKPPSSVNVYGRNPTTVRVTWRYVSPSPDEEPLLGFKIRVWETDQDMSSANDTIVPGGSKLEIDIDNLSVGKEYFLRVLAYSNGGDGRMSSPAHRFRMGDPSDYRNAASQKILNASLGILTIIILHIYHCI